MTSNTTASQQTDEQQIRGVIDAWAKPLAPETSPRS